MSSTSIARQNRRKKLKQLPPITSLKVPQVLMLSPAALDSSTDYDGSPNLSQCDSELDSERKLEQKIDQEKDSEEKENFNASTGCSFVQCDVSSRPVGKVFIEEERGFKAIDLSENFQPHFTNAPHQTELKSELGIDLACRTARYFHGISNFLHGVLGGMSLLHILLLFHLIYSENYGEDLLNHYSFLSQPVHNVFNFLCIVCCISAFDRYDIGNPKQLYHSIKRCDIKVLVLIIYPICLILSLSTASVDEKFCLPQANLTALELLKVMESQDELFYWKTLSLSKCFGVLIGWIIISWDPNSNLFYKKLKGIKEQSRKSGGHLRNS
ncbi:transmembrane protein 237B-like [Uloborus diversus]|uniref:transmembrane protein 237B-like n=1 Tax=Uloborus diversus TaxID=327109 RepID=UPI00240A25AF|nr:transmembrane protein 237B-like [Uloborus diversus]